MSENCVNTFFSPPSCFSPAARQVLKGLSRVYANTKEGKKEDAPAPALSTLLSNVLPPIVICIDTYLAGDSDSLAPSAAAARRGLCAGLFSGSIQGASTGPLCSAPDLIKNMGMVFGTAAGRSLREGVRLSAMVGEDGGTDPNYDAAASFHVLDLFCTGTEAASGGDNSGKRRVGVDMVLTDPFLAPLARRWCCRTCGLLGSATKSFQACSLCLDPSVGRFCSKEPCFAAFWRGGHKRDCAGRDKMKKK
jgi:hypothetical protein